MISTCCWSYSAKIYMKINDNLLLLLLIVSNNSSITQLFGNSIID